MKPIFTLSSKPVFLLVYLFLGFLFTSHAQQIAFPGAEGAGRFTSGGRGTVPVPTTVFEVSNLNDDNNPGSLRYALSQPATHRTVVFRISGTIHLNSRLTIRANTTIAGQTAPGDGICIADYPTVISGDNVIVRYMRFRMGDKNQLITNPAGCGVPVAPFNASCMPVDGSGGDDTFGNLGNKNIIIDHCTVSWSSDEALTIYRGDSLTLQWNIISEPLNYSYHFETGDIDFERHGYGGIWGAKRGSFHHNLIADAQGRSPRFAGSSTYTPNIAGTENSDFRNNVIYNWGAYSTNGGEGGNYNLVNNYYKYGPSTSTGSSAGVSIRNEIMNPSKSTDLPYPKLFINGNYVDGAAAVTQNNWLGIAMAGGTQADTALSKVTSPFDIAPVTTQTAAEAYEWVLQYAGASYKRDTLDQRIVNDVRNRTGKIIDVQGGYPHGTAYNNTINAWPSLNATTAPADDDHDGMPNSWEIANGLNPNDPSDRGVFAPNGYTNLENYLNNIVGSPAIAASVNSFNNFTHNAGVPSSVQTYVVSGTSLNGNITVTPPAGYQVSADGGTTWFTNAAPLTLTQTAGSVSPKTISIRLNAASAGTYNGNLSHSSTGAAAVSIPLNGTAVTTTAPAGTNAIVARDGSGNYTSIQAAINAAPAGLTSPYIIFIKNGKYIEKVNIPSNKPFIQLVGESAANTIISYGDGASTALPGGGTVGTFNSYTLYIAANDCGLANLTIVNSFGDGSQAVALRIDADRVMVRSCRIMGNQDTMLNNANAGLRQYFRNCYIDGNVDYIFGSARVILDSCVIYSKDRTSAGASYLTAANTQAGQSYGYVFRNCILPPNLGVTNYYLGRPWQNSTGSSPVANNKTVFINSIMSSSVRPEGWSIWDAGTNTSVIYYGEYKTKKFDGTLVNVSGRVPWSKQLTDTEAAAYTDANLFGSWTPCSAGILFCESKAPEIAISNFRGKKGATNSVFDWNSSWAMPQIKYELYRSSLRTGGYTKVSELTSQEDTTYNFQLTDVFPPIGSIYYYYVVGSRAGFLSNITDTIEISSMPTITATGTLNVFTQNYGTPSGTQSFVSAGINLSGNIIITPPVAYEVSANGGSTWFNNTNPLNLSPVNNSVANTTVLVRLNANALGSFGGNISLTSNGAATVNVAVTGTCAIIAQPTSVLLQHWPFTINAGDSVSVRSAGVTASTPAMNVFSLSNGTTVTSIPAYSPALGQAFGGSSGGAGLWTTASGGPGGNLSRLHYEQFTITAKAGYAVRVDSLLFASAFYNTSSNTKVGVVYSLSGFATDSSTITTTPGTFASPIALANQVTGPTNTYALAFNDVNGITLAAGQTLTFRLYFSCGSTSTGRYAFLKDVKVIGKATDLAAPLPAISTSGTVSAFTQFVGTPSAAQTYTVSGSNLNGTVYVIAPANFEISNDAGATWKTSVQPVLLAPSSGTLSPATIAVRLNATAAGPYSGNIQHLTSGTATVNFPVSGNAIAPPVMTVTGSLSAFSHNAGTPSALQTYTLTGANLASSITVTPPAGFEVSVNGTDWFTNSNPLVVTQTAGSANATLRVRMNAAVAGTYSGAITHTTNNGTPKSISVNGTALNPPVFTVTASLNQFIQFLPDPSPVQSYQVTGNNLLNNVIITPPFRYQVSLDGGASWSSNPVSITPVNATINTTVQVRLNAIVNGTYVGTIVNLVSGVATISIPVEGYAAIQGRYYVLFPNPAYRIMNFTHPVAMQNGVLIFYNMLGVKIRTMVVAAGSFVTTVDVSDLPQGQYLLKYENGVEKGVMKLHRY
jgi:pectin methylesterase-like acyl-CoA thioesterase